MLIRSTIVGRPPIIEGMLVHFSHIDCSFFVHLLAWLLKQAGEVCRKSLSYGFFQATENSSHQDSKGGRRELFCCFSIMFEL